MGFQSRGFEGLLLQLSNDGFCADAYAIAAELSDRALPAEQISTTDCAAKYRLLSNPEGGGTRRWLLNRTPYMRGIQDAMDDPRCRMVIVAGPERSGKSVGGENYKFKMLRHGPVVDTIVYLPPGDSPERYADKEFRDFFDLHPEIRSKLGKTASDNAKRSKRVSGKLVRVMAMADRALRQLEAPLIIATEIDSLPRAVATKVIQEIRGRQKSFGNAAKAYIESHPDLGEGTGISAGWKEGSRSVLYWTCIHCEKVSTAHHLAPKTMRAVMVYDRDDRLEDAERKLNAMQTARLKCPHCDDLIDDDQRYEMIDNSFWVDGETAVNENGSGNSAGPFNPVQSFWLHGLNVKRPLGDLAAEHLKASVHFESRRDHTLLKRYHVKSLGEPYDGAAVRKAASIRQAAEKQQESFSFERGTFPDGFKFIVAAVDQGGRKFDVAWYAWDLEGRSALLDRLTITDRVGPNGERREIRPAENIDDWMQLQQIVIERKFPLTSDPEMLMPVALVAIDTGGSGKRDKGEMPEGATYKAREFARRMYRAGKHWGDKRYQIVKLFKGFASKEDAIILGSRDINIDENRKPVTPSVKEFNVNVNRTKAVSLSRLAIDDGGPGQCYFATGLPNSVYDELAAEKFVNGTWERHGANETWDLFGYCEALRTLLDPDNERYNWNKHTPVWALPVSKEQAAKPVERKLSNWELRQKLMEQGD